MSTNLPNPNGPPPKFPLSQLNPGPETKEDWDQFIRWLLLFWRQNQSSSQLTQANQALEPILPYTILRPEGLPYTFEFDALSASLATNPLRIQRRTATTPSMLDIAAGTAPVTGNALFDIQTSPDQVVWTSILQAPAALPQGSLHAPTVLTFAAGALLKPGNWIQGIVANGSDLSALKVALQLAVA
jgi:hypothetical protein